jgi:hypothetical protein
MCSSQTTGRLASSRQTEAKAGRVCRSGSARSVRHALMSATAHSLVLMDGDVWGLMDHYQLQQAVQLLADSPAQKLAVVPQPLVGHFEGLPCRLFTLEIRQGMTRCACTDL